MQVSEEGKVRGIGPARGLVLFPKWPDLRPVCVRARATFADKIMSPASVLCFCHSLEVGLREKWKAACLEQWLSTHPPSPLTVSARGYLAISKVVLVFTGRRGGGVSVVAIWHLVDRCR